MLTNLYYYDYYKPYIVKTPDYYIGKAKSSRANNRTDDQNQIGEDSGYSVYLNKSYNKNVISYANSIYKNITKLKDTSKKIINDLDFLKKFVGFSEFDKDAYTEVLNKDIENFTVSYNNSHEFLEKQGHSKSLKEFSDRIESNVIKNSNVLRRVGITKNNEIMESSGILDSFWNKKMNRQNINNVKEAFETIYDDTTKTLQTPMSNHMGFKNLSYYYNYIADKVHVDTFKIISSGMIVNLAL